MGERCLGKPGFLSTWFQKEALWAQQVLAATRGQEIHSAAGCGRSPKSRPRGSPQAFQHRNPQASPRRNSAALRDLPWLPIAQRQRLQFLSPLLSNSSSSCTKPLHRPPLPGPCPPSTHKTQLPRPIRYRPVPGTLLAG